MGDLNIQVSESTVLQRQLRTGDFFDAHSWGSSLDKNKVTSHKGKGSRIDMILANKVAARLLESYRVVPGISSTDHSEVMVGLHVPLACQTRYISCLVGNRVKNQQPPKDYIPPMVTCILIFSHQSGCRQCL